MNLSRGRSLLLLAGAAMLLSTARGEEVKSGPRDRIGGHFEVNVVTGELQGKTNYCYVCKFAMAQIPATVLIFTQKVDDDLATLVKAVDGVQKKNAKLGTVLVGIGSVTEEDLRKFQTAHKLLAPLTLGIDPDGPKRYQLNKQAVVTVVVYELGGVVHESFGFSDTRSAAARANDIAAAAKKVLDKPR